MTRIVTGVSLIAFTSFWAYAQSPARPEFEVASVKPAKSSNDGRIMIRMGSDPGRINYTNVSLKNLLTRAYNVKDYQIIGPDWLNIDRFDVTATHEPGLPAETIQLMLQALLKERFKMTVHTEKRTLPVYALMEAKGGFKLKPLPEEPAGTAPEGVPGAAPGAPPAPAGASVSGGPHFKKSGGKMGDGPPPGGRGMIMFGGRGHFEAKGITISALTNFLANITGRPVVDTTKIKGIYDITLDYTPDETTAGRGFPGGMSFPPTAVSAGPGGPGGGPGGPGTPGEYRPAAQEGAAEAPPLFAALQEKLGLKLDARKEPLDVIVVDAAEKVPTEN